MCYTYMQLSLAYGIIEPIFGAVERQGAREQYVEQDPRRPHVHGLAIGLSLHHLGTHEVWRPYSPCHRKWSRWLSKKMVIEVS